MTYNRIVIATVIIMIIVFAVGPWRAHAPATIVSPRTIDKPLVIVTTFPLTVFAKNVGEPMLDVRPLLPPGVGPHEYAPTPSDVLLLHNANLIIRNGRGLDDWLTPFLQETSARVITVTDGLPSRLLEGSPDPHVWLDPVLAQRMTETMRDAFIALNPQRKNDFMDAQRQYAQRLNRLNDQIHTGLDRLHGKPYIAFHDAFGYFNDQYGLRQVGSFEPVPGQEPTAQELAAIRTFVKTYHLKAIFVEPQYSPKVVVALTQELGISMHVLDPIETGTISTTAYEETMLRNLTTLQQWL